MILKMSVTTDLNQLSLDQRRTIARECTCKELRKQSTRQPIRGEAEILEAYSVNGDVVHLPLVYGQTRLNLERKPRDSCRKIRLNFQKSLYPEQEEIISEIRPGLKRHGTALIRIPTGAGKTLTAV